MTPDRFAELCREIAPCLARTGTFLPKNWLALPGNPQEHGATLGHCCNPDALRAAFDEVAKEAARAEAERIAAELDRAAHGDAPKLWRHWVVMFAQKLRRDHAE